MLSQIWFVLQKKKTIKIQGKVISREIFPKKRGRLLHYLRKMLHRLNRPFQKEGGGRWLEIFKIVIMGRVKIFQLGVHPKMGGVSKLETKRFSILILEMFLAEYNLN